ncbi:MAG: 16S rRNA (adenine(1518)-N(6)/adenine(1519)-N(6))-dimethyltransferase RsmA [Patescibacteria group bacterium]|nr:16S rRNA (adenine(1518)-N(6)/adenine(1519)-N(6))-dimethyltransferase RsmA [Patescibacteria group bacterium]
MDLKKQLRDFGHKPDKDTGQNFLIDQATLKKIVGAANLTQEDLVLEIGAGPGNLTELLAQACKKVIAVERDRRLLPILKKNLKTYSNVEIICDDIFYWRAKAGSSLPEFNYKIVANLPYYLTAHLLKEFISQPPKPKSLTLLIQNEVADRLTAQPGELSLLAVSVQYYADVKKMFLVPRELFWPEPEVDSAVVQINHLRETKESDKDFFRLVRIGFSSRRKQLQNNLRAGLHLDVSEINQIFDKCGISLKARAQELSLDDWNMLVTSINTQEKATNQAKTSI